jgi:alpha-tubulin suppressor-like RCC1 family protein
MGLHGWTICKRNRRKLVKTAFIGIGNLLVWIFLVTNAFAQSNPPGGLEGGTNGCDPLSCNFPDYGTNLWLSINLSNDVVHLLLHNTQPGVRYQIRSRENFTSGSWFDEETVTGTIADAITPATLNTGERTNCLFIQVFTWMTNAAGKASVMLAIGGERIMELTASGDVVSWGGNQSGELGDYTFLDSSNPVHVIGLTNVVKIASGLSHSLALDENGKLWAWGANNVGQLGDGGAERDSNLPEPVAGMTNIIAIAAHGYANGDGEFGLSVAVKADGTIWMWGAADGFGFGSSPTQIEGITNVIKVAAGAVHALALKTDGTVWAWGENFLDQLGDGTKNSSDIPVQVIGLSNVVAVCAGDNHSLALDANSNVWAWGYNGARQLGDGGVEDENDTPVMVVGLTNVIGIAAGASHSMAVDAQGGLWAWGDDGWGQLGDGGSVGRTDLPFQVPGMSNIISVTAGPFASAALAGNGHWWQFGAGGDWPFLESWDGKDGYPKMSPAYVDFYNGRLPSLQILSGNNQTLHAGLEFQQPLIFKVADANGTALSNAPVSVEVVSGDMQLRTANGGSNYKGLRLTTDGDGEVRLIGYADGFIFSENCLVRILAASCERVAEVDLSETLVPPPTITITSPIDGSAYLVGTNQSLMITVDAEAAPGASIEEVDYYYQTNGGASTLLGFSTQNPYSFNWTNALWWTHAFSGQYFLSAVVVDNGGAQSDSQNVNITVALDSDCNGMADCWELQYFQHLGIDPDAEADGDGINNLLEYQYGTDPVDYYNGRLPYLEILGGNDQAGGYDSFLPQPVSIKVSGSQYVGPALSNAPVTFAVTQGTALLAATTNDTPVTSLVLRTDTNAQVLAWVYFASAGSGPPDSTILVSAFSETNSVAVTVSEFVPLGNWTFNNTNTWIGEAGQLPLLNDNLAGIPSWSSNSVLVDSLNPSTLSYNVMEANGSTNINCQVGSVLFWFRPDWNSSNAGGIGPGSWGRLIEMGSFDPVFTNGWWGLYLSPDGTQLLFGTSTNGGGMTNLSANITWYSNEWYQIALTYSPTGSALYVDGQLLADGDGMTYRLNADELTKGFRIGSDQDGNNQAAGSFDELETFNYPLDAANTYSHESEIPDWWEVKYFNRTGLDPGFSPAGDGRTFSIDYHYGFDPNVINFSLYAARQYVNSSLVPFQLNITNGMPYYMAVAVTSTNFVVEPNQLFDINSYFVGTPWQPYDSNIVVSLNSGDGDYYVWVGLKGISPDAETTWHGTRLTVDTSPPILTITNPINGTVSQPIIQLQGRANESLSSLTYDVSNTSGIWTNQTAYVTGQFCDTNLLAITTNYFQCYNVALVSNGVNLITFHAADLAGNTTTTSFGFTLDASADSNPPEMTLVWPQNGTYINGSNFTLQAQVSDPITAVVATIVDASGNTNIIQGLVEQGGSVWVQNLPLASGENMLTITATDSAGNTSVTNLTVFQSNIIVTMNPLAGDQLNQSSMNISGTVSDSSYTVTVNGVTATVCSDGTWEADNVPVSSSGTAIFDVETYSGSAPNVVRANQSLTPMDAPSVGSAGSQLFAMTLPVKVGLMSYLRIEHPSSGLIEGGMYCAVSPCCGPAFGNYGDMIHWTYQGGGLDGGYDYSSGYFNSGPGSPGWIMISTPSYCEWGYPIPAGEDAYYAPWENISDAEYYIQTRVMIEPQGQIAAGTTVTYLVQAQASGLPPAALQIRGATLMDDGSGAGYMLLSAPAGVNVDVTPLAAGNYTFNVQAQQLDMQLAVDNNRDGQITFDNSDLTTPTKPYRFWINDSNEHGDDESDVGADDQIPGQPAFVGDANGGEVPYANYANNRIQGRSDLVNFFPVVLCLSNALQLLPTSSGYEYHLYQADSSAVGGALKFIYTSLTPANAFDFLTNTASAGYGANFDEAAMSADTIPVNHDVMLDTNFLARIQNNGGTGVILVEGCAATPQPLMLEIWRNGKLLAGTPLYLSISGVEQMFRHVNLCYVNGTVEVPARADAPNEPQTIDKNFIFLHGYNVNQQQARGVLSEVFKRMYWSGSKARFYGVTWNGAESKEDAVIQTLPQRDQFTPNFHTNVLNALQTAPHLADLLNGLSGETTVVAHSLGNMAVLSAISDCNVTAIKHYFMIDCAVPIEAVQGDTPKEPAMIYSTWQDYSNRLYASDWWQLFTNDYRSTLTWSNRLGNLGNVDIYNFYSNGEEVLREDLDDPPSSVIGSVLQEAINAIGFWGGAGLPFGTYAWAWQEKGKGTDTSDAFIGSTHGGWKFSYYWVDSFGKSLSPSIMNDTLNSILQHQPMFSFASSPNGPPDEDLLGADGSTYAQANRDRILSDAIPALTLPVGVNHVDRFAPRNADDNNFNMQTSFETGWPAARSNPADDEAYKWHHSDFDYVAYPFTYTLFNQIVASGNLKQL